MEMDVGSMTGVVLLQRIDNCIWVFADSAKMDHMISVSGNNDAAAEAVLQKILSAAMSNDCLNDTLTMILRGVHGPKSANACQRCVEKLLQNASAILLAGVLKTLFAQE